MINAPVIPVANAAVPMIVAVSLHCSNGTLFGSQSLRWTELDGEGDRNKVVVSEIGADSTEGGL